MAQNQKINPAQLKLLNTLVSKLHINKEDKMIMVAGFSAAGETSSKELLFNEATVMISYLKTFENKADPARLKMTGKIFYYAHEMQWQTVNSAGKVVADSKRVNEWCLKFSYLKKPLNAYTLQELPILVSQFAQVYKSFLKGL